MVGLDGTSLKRCVSVYSVQLYTSGIQFYMLRIQDQRHPKQSLSFDSG